MPSNLTLYIKRVLILLVGMWTISLLFIRLQWSSEPSAAQSRTLQDRLDEMSKDLSTLHTENEQLRVLLNNIGDEMKKGGPVHLPDQRQMLVQPLGPTPSESMGGPNAEQEYLRRRVENEVRELWRFMGTELQNLAGLNDKDLSQQVSRMSAFLARSREQHHILMANTERLAEDGGVKDWRVRELDALADELQQKIRKIQNPSDCSKVRKAYCDMRKGCGFGCVVHHVLHCFVIALATGRTLVLDPVLYRYSGIKWTDYFLPPSDTCRNLPVTEGNWGGASSGDSMNFNHNSDLVIPIIDGLSNPRPDYLPQAVPQEFVDRISHLHGAPFPWFVGQLLAYLTRPNEKLLPELEKRVSVMTGGDSGKLPIVGVHVRRTDKVGSEAKFHALSEYMVWVEDWFQKEEFRRLPLHPGVGDAPKKLARRVYLATDEPSLLGEAKQKYPEYEFISDVELSKAAGLSQRYSSSGLRSIVLDTLLLSNTDYLVCTFSSQVCRLAYELMQTRHKDVGDASNRFYSLDDIYYFGGQNAHQARVLYPHNSGSGWPHASSGFQELNVKPGEVVGIAGNHWNGFTIGSVGVHTGKVPSYKMEFIQRKATYFNVSAMNN